MNQPDRVVYCTSNTGCSISLGVPRLHTGWNVEVLLRGGIRTISPIYESMEVKHEPTTKNPRFIGTGTDDEQSD